MDVRCDSTAAVATEGEHAGCGILRIEPFAQGQGEHCLAVFCVADFCGHDDGANSVTEDSIDGEDGNGAILRVRISVIDGNFSVVGFCGAACRNGCSESVTFGDNRKHAFAVLVSYFTLFVVRLEERELERIQNAAAAKRLGELNPDAIAASVAVAVVDKRCLDLRNWRLGNVDVCPLNALILCDC